METAARADALIRVAEFFQRAEQKMNNVVKPTSRLETPASHIPEKIVPLAPLDLAEEASESVPSLEEVFALPFTTPPGPACGQDFATSDIFCISCGEYLEAAEQPQLKPAYCGECSATVSPDDIFCLSCSAVLA